MFNMGMSCPKTQMINQSKYAWNDYDKKEMRYAEKRCKQIYKDAPCLKRFYKLDVNDYFALCGKSKK